MTMTKKVIIFRDNKGDTKLVTAYETSLIADSLGNSGEQCASELWNTRH